MKNLFYLTLVLLVSSCAMISGTKNDKVYIASNPQGAEIFIDGKSYGPTPANLDIEAKNSRVVLTKEGYGSTEFALEAQATMKNGACSTDALFAILPWSLYSAQWSGYCNEFKKKDYMITIPRQRGANNSAFEAARNPQEMMNYYYQGNNSSGYNSSRR